MSSVRIQLSESMLAPPVKLEMAFANPDSILDLIDKGAPYKTITAVQKNPPNGDTPGWFRNFWALGGKVLFDGADDAFYNPVFIEAAKKSFQAEIIQPLAMMTNLNVPAGGCSGTPGSAFFQSRSSARSSILDASTHGLFGIIPGVGNTSCVCDLLAL